MTRPEERRIRSFDGVDIARWHAMARVFNHCRNYLGKERDNYIELQCSGTRAIACHLLCRRALRDISPGLSDADDTFPLPSRDETPEHPTRRCHRHFRLCHTSVVFFYCNPRGLW